MKCGRLNRKFFYSAAFHLLLIHELRTAVQGDLNLVSEHVEICEKSKIANILSMAVVL